MSEFKPYYGKESNFQITAAIFLDSCRIIWFHPPNGGSRNAREAANLKKQGVKPGVPDIIIMEARKGFHGFVIELKVGRNKPSPYQLIMLKNLKDRGYKVLLTYSLDELMYEVEKYLE